MTFTCEGETHEPTGVASDASVLRMAHNLELLKKLRERVLIPIAFGTVCFMCGYCAYLGNNPDVLVRIMSSFAK